MDNALVSDLPAPQRQALVAQAQQTLIERSKRSGVVFVVVIAAIAWGSPLGSEHPILVGALLAASTLLIVPRWWLAYRLLRTAAPDPGQYNLYRAVLFASGSVWIVFSCASVALYGTGGPVILVAATMAGVTCGAAVTTSIDLLVYKALTLITVLPFAVALALVGTPTGYALALLFAGFLGLNLSVGKQLHGDFWTSARTRHLMEARAAELDGARLLAEDAARAKAGFLAAMSHELRTPLNGVIGMADLLSKTPLGTVQRRYAEIIASSADHLLTLINDVLDVSRLEAGKVELEKAPLRFDELCDDVAELVALSAADKGLDLLVIHARPLPMVGDAARLRQVITNLLSNAIKFTEQGFVALRTTAIDGGIAFSVEDTGIGIPEETQRRIFEPFTQADASTTRRFGGTGLGLTIVQGLVDAMQGTLEVRSEVGRGTCFQVSLRAEVQTATEPRADGVGRVMLVDDVPARRAALVEVLQTLGLQVEVPPLAAFDREALSELSFEPSAPASSPGDEDPVVPLSHVLLSSDLLTADQRSLRARCPVPLILLERTRDPLSDVEAVAQPYRRSALVRALTAPPPDDSVDTELTYGMHAAPRFEARVLVVEDNAVNRMVARQSLEALGCQVTCVPDGARAVELASRQQFDLILMDCQMPVLDGYEATKAIRASESNRGRTPIVAMTAQVGDEARERAFAVGMDDWVDKPVKPDRLADVLRGLTTSQPRGNA